MAKILIIGEKDICDLLERELTQKSFDVKSSYGMDEAYKLLQSDGFDLLLYDFRIHNEEGLSLLSHLRALKPNTPVILLSNNPDLATFMQAIREGAVDCITDPLSSNNLLLSIQEALETRYDNHAKGEDDSPLSLKESAHRAELAVILRVPEQTKYNRTKAARILNIDRKTLYNKLKLMDLPQDGGSGEEDKS